MTTIVGLSGSLREGSYNLMLLRAATTLAPADSRIEIASIRGIPLYDGDIEARDGVPAVVEELKAKIAAADALLLSTPEYNNSIPGVFKNAIDWMSRPPRDIPRVFKGRPVALMGATPGLGLTSLAQAAWLPVLRTLGTMPFFGGRMAVANAGKAFSAEGELVDNDIRERLKAFVADYVNFIRAVRRSG